MQERLQRNARLSFPEPSAFDAAGNISSASAPVSVLIHDETCTAFADWVAGNFTDAEQANDAISGPAADPDGAGMNNYARYAFALPARGPVANPITLGTADSANVPDPTAPPTPQEATSA